MAEEPGKVLHPEGGHGHYENCGVEGLKKQNWSEILKKEKFLIRVNEKKSTLTTDFKGRKLDRKQKLFTPSKE